MSVGAVHLLQKSLADAQKDLTSTNDAIRKLTGRDPDQPPSRPGPDRRPSGGRMRAWSVDFDSPAAKRRDVAGGRMRLAGRLGPRMLEGRRDSDGEEGGEKDAGKPSLQSSVVATTAPPRPKADPSQDEKSKTRNRRMFGFLMGTLQKFKESEEAAKYSEKERRRSEIEDRLTRNAQQEREEAVRERKGLFEQRRAMRDKVVRLESHMATVKMYEEWNNHDRKLCSFIKTKAKPPIFYLPAHLTPETEELLKQSRTKIQETIAQRETEAQSFLEEPSTVVPIAVIKSELMDVGGGDVGEGGGEEGVREGGEQMEVEGDRKDRGRGVGSEVGSESD